MFTQVKAQQVTQNTGNCFQKYQNDLEEIRYVFDDIHPDAYMDAIEKDISDLKNLKETVLHNGVISSQLAEYLSISAPGIQNILYAFYSAEKDTALSQETLISIVHEIDNLIAAAESDIEEKTSAYIKHAHIELDDHLSVIHATNEALGYKSAKSLIVNTRMLIDIAKKASLISISALFFAEIFAKKGYKQKEVAGFIDALNNTKDVLSSFASFSTEEHMDEDVVEKTIEPIKALGIYTEDSSAIRSENNILTDTTAYGRSLRSLGYTEQNFKSMAKDLGPTASNQEKILTTSKDVIEKIEKNNDITKAASQRGVKNVKKITKRHFYTLRQVKKQMEDIWKNMMSYQSELNDDSE